jgi:hypothetical protein
MVCRYPPAEGDSDGCRGQHQDPEHGHPLQARHHTQADAGPQAQVKMLYFFVSQHSVRYKLTVLVPCYLKVYRTFTPTISVPVRLLRIWFFCVRIHDF